MTIRESAALDAQSVAMAPLVANPPPRSVAEVLNELRYTEDRLEEIAEERTELMVRLTALHERREALGSEAIDLGRKRETLTEEFRAALTQETRAKRERKAAVGA